jgi:hypothetical protein
LSRSEDGGEVRGGKEDWAGFVMERIWENLGEEKLVEFQDFLKNFEQT